MAPPQNAKKKKKKGRAPAHQNTFAFRHNPKSKKTDSILSSPISACCRRCHDKLVWRKQYRRYKPLTQPAICSVCHERKIRSAYHTRCTSCRGELCAVCGKEPPIGLDQDVMEQDDGLSGLSGKKLTLRQRKTLERQMANNRTSKKRASSVAESDEPEPESDDDMDAMYDIDNSEDPFLNAIGGSIVTGAEYRDQILQQGGSKIGISQEETMDM